MKRLRVFMRKDLFTDLVILSGLGMIFYGLYMHWPWLAFVVVGVVVLVFGLVMIR